MVGASRRSPEWGGIGLRPFGVGRHSVNTPNSGCLRNSNRRQQRAANLLTGARRAWSVAATMAAAFACSILQCSTFGQAWAAETAASSAATQNDDEASSSVASAATELDAHDYTTPRYEPAGFPLLGGDSDIGFEFGVVGTLSRFGNGAVPYQWNMDLALALSVKNGPNGKEITQQSYQWNVDVPNLDGGRVRLNPQLLYYRTVNQLYFGVGNASNGRLPVGATSRHFEFDDRQARLRELTRIRLRSPVDLMIGTSFRYENPHVYSGSQLESDAATGVVRGARPLSLLTLAAGLVYDTRDNEIFPRRGSYGDMGLRATLGAPFAAGVRYGGAGARLAKYLPLGGPAILALRGVADLEFGNVPVYDLYTGGVFLTDEMIGGSSSVG